MEETRIMELDGLRAVAVLLVLVWHYFGVPDGRDYWLWKALHVGRFGVDLFFVLSGYLITNILLKNRNSPTYFSSFYGRRALRIWPIYYVMCAAAFVGWLFRLSPTLFDTNGVAGWTYLLGLQNIAIAFAQNNGVYWLGGTWSLAIEEQFYLLFPLLVWKVPPERLLGILLVPIIVGPIGRLIDSPLHDAYGWYVLPQFRADSLAIGALVAWWRLYRKPSETVTLLVHKWFNRALLCLPLLWLLGAGRWSVAFSHTIAGGFFGLAISRFGEPWRPEPANSSRSRRGIFRENFVRRLYDPSCRDLHPVRGNGAGADAYDIIRRRYHGHCSRSDICHLCSQLSLFRNAA